jgi:hypothetical protein
MESRFGHDFSQVRIHTDAKAVASARRVNALAYTVGRNVVFGAGQYAPESRAGQGLLAHELTHVVQQKSLAPTFRTRTSLQVGAVNDAYERQASQVEQRILENGTQPGAQAPSIFQHQAPLVVSNPVAQRGFFEFIDNLFGGTNFSKTELDSYLQELREKGSVGGLRGDNKARTFVKLWRKDQSGFDLNADLKVKLIKEMQAGFTGNDDEQAILDLLENSDSNDLKKIFAPGAVNVADLNKDFHGAEWDSLQMFYQKRFVGGMKALLEGQVEPKAPEKAPAAGKTPTGTAQADTADSAQGMADPAANVLSDALPVQERRRIRVSTTVSVPLGAIDVEDLFSTKGAKTTILLPPDVTVQFAGKIPDTLHHGLRNVAAALSTTARLNPAPLEVNSTITLALDLGDYGGDYAAFRFTYVEHRPPKGKPTQEILIERLGSIGTEKLSVSKVENLQKKFDAHQFKRGNGWSDSQYQDLLAAIAEISDARLSPINGITFERDRVNAEDPNVGGNYNPETHTITMFDRALEGSMARYGVPGAEFTNEAVRQIRHEIGHALDHLPLRSAWSQFEKAGQTASAKKTLLGARSRSGLRYVQNREGILEDVEGDKQAGKNDFRLAAEKDGKTRITKYSEQEWQEYFAESFSFYITDPATLKRLRPNVYTYFAQNYPS